MLNKIALPLALTIILLLVSGQEAECKTTPDNSSNINSTAFVVGDDELLMDFSELSRRVLAAAALDIGKALKADQVTCNAQVQGSCIGKDSKFYNKRPCDYKQYCRFPQ